MINLAGKYIKFLIIVIFISTAFFAKCQNDSNIQYYATDNYWQFFIFDFESNRYCFTNVKEAFVGSSTSSYGNIIKIGDTVFVQSDYNNKRLSLEVDCNIDTKFDSSTLVFDFVRFDDNPLNDKAYKIERERLLFGVINEIDTINLNSDTIRLPYKIEKFQLLSYNEGYIKYSSEDYINVNNCNNFTVKFIINPNYAFYKALNDTIVLKNSKAVWYLSDENKYVNLEKTSFRKIRNYVGYSDCWDNDNKIVLDNY
jgi:hypothetical protein